MELAAFPLMLRKMKEINRERNPRGGVFGREKQLLFSLGVLGYGIRWNFLLFVLLLFFFIIYYIIIFIFYKHRIDKSLHLSIIIPYETLISFFLICFFLYSTFLK